MSIRMKAKDLLLKRNDLVSFFGITCDCDAGNGKRKAQFWRNSSCDNSVVAKNLFDFVGIRCFATNSNAGIVIMGKLWTPEMKSAGSIAHQG